MSGSIGSPRRGTLPVERVRSRAEEIRRDRRNIRAPDGHFGPVDLISGYRRMGIGRRRLGHRERNLPPLASEIELFVVVRILDIDTDLFQSFRVGCIFVGLVPVVNVPQPILPLGFPALEHPDGMPTSGVRVSKFDVLAFGQLVTDPLPGSPGRFCFRSWR